MYKADQKKWNQFSVNTQFKNIAAELARATQAALYNRKENQEQINGAYERAITLIDASIADSKQKDKSLLYQLRDTVAVLYADNVNPAIGRFVCNQVLAKSENNNL